MADTKYKINGSVLKAQDGAAVVGIEVEVEAIDGTNPHPSEKETGNDGTFTFDAVKGNYQVRLDEVPAADKDGALWQPRPPDKGDRHVRVQGEAVNVEPILVEPVHSSVTGTVLRVTDKTGVEDVKVVLRATGADEASGVTAETNDGGRFEFPEVSAGSYVVSLEKSPVKVGSERLEPVLADPDGGRREVSIPANVNVLQEVAPILLERERHRIFGTVRRSPGGPPVPFAKILVLDPQGEEVARLEADRNGAYEFRADEPGTFLLEVTKDGFRRIDTVVVASDNEHDLVGEDVGAAVTPAATQDLATFPLLTESVTLAPAPMPSGAPTSTVGQTVESALREALGWRPRWNDPGGFSAALAHSFDLHEVEGHTEATWTPRTYAAQVQADLGAITGAQASVYSRARVALDAALPLLDGLYPLDPAADPQDTEAIRSIVRSELTELVAELGVEGGPRLSRVDDLLDLLLRSNIQTRVRTTAGGQLGLLEDRFGLTPGRVDTIDEEENLTNFLILVDYVKEIDTSWQQRRDSFDPTSTATPFLGTQLVLLSRSLAVVAESVTEVNYTMDSVFLGAAERLAIRLQFTGTSLQDSKNRSFDVPVNTPSILLAELLSWVERVASEEGPRLLQDGGKDGAVALTPVLDKLRKLVRAALLDTGSGPSRGQQSQDSVPAGYATSRVQRALAELAKYLDDTTGLANQLRR